MFHHVKSLQFEAALDSIQSNFPQGVVAANPRYQQTPITFREKLSTAHGMKVK